VLARGDVSRYDEIGAWPLAEALRSFEALMRERARDEYRLAMMSWSGEGEAPRRPAILEVW